MSTPAPETENVPDASVAWPLTAGLPISSVCHGAGSVPVVAVKTDPLLATPFTVTTTLPVVAPAGAGTTMLAADHAVGIAAVPLKVTVLVPFVAPKLVPVTVTGVPTGPLAGASEVIVGGAPVIVQVTPLLAIPPTVTTTFPVVAPTGTGTAMLF